jgi:hypothetical protein
MEGSPSGGLADGVAPEVERLLKAMSVPPKANVRTWVLLGGGVLLVIIFVLRVVSQSTPGAARL